MKATKLLKEEHQGVKLALSILEKINQKLKKNEKVNLEHLEQLLEFLKIFVDKCHHSKEEKVLFPAMEETGVPKEGGPIGMMLYEHNLGRGYIKEFAEALEEYKKGNLKAAAKIVQSTTGYIELLQDHIEKEENILYQIADVHLTSKNQQELVKKFDDIENKEIGPGKHNEFHQMLDGLEKIYLN